jgi:hypothetical protein
MKLILITEFLSRHDIFVTFDRYYRNNHRACVLKKKIFSGDYSVYAVARAPREGESIPIEHELDLDTVSDKFSLRIIGSEILSKKPCSPPG